MSSFLPMPVVGSLFGLFLVGCVAIGAGAVIAINAKDTIAEADDWKANARIVRLCPTAAIYVWRGGYWINRETQIAVEPREACP